MVICDLATLRYGDQAVRMAGHEASGVRNPYALLMKKFLKRVWRFIRPSGSVLAKETTKQPHGDWTNP
jgi:hypothetical protein